MEYPHIEDSAHADLVAAALLAEETSHFNFCFEREVHLATVRNVNVSDRHRMQVGARIEELNAAISESEIRHSAITTLITDPLAHAEAIARVLAKRGQ